jgi:hypothetical protein
MTDARDPWSIHHFSQSNPEGAGQGSVSALLRRVADSLDALGNIRVADITFSASPTDGEDDLSITIYYERID